MPMLTRAPPNPGHSEFRMLRGERLPDIRLALRPARSSDGDALQTYVRGLSPQSRYNRFLGAANELPASELARALAANGRDTLTLLLTSTVEDREPVVGETRVALSCAERAGEFSMSIADDWQHVGDGQARRARQHHADLPALPRPGAEPGRERLPVPPPELARKHRLRRLQRDRRRRMRRLAKAHRSTRNHHVHRNAQLGSRRSEQITFGMTSDFQQGIVVVRAVPFWPSQSKSSSLQAAITSMT